MGRPRLETRLTAELEEAIRSMKFGDIVSLAQRFHLNRGAIVRLRQLLDMPPLHRPPAGDEYYKKRARKQYEARTPKREGITLRQRNSYFTKVEMAKLEGFTLDSSMKLQQLWYLARHGSEQEQQEARRILKQKYSLTAPPLPGEKKASC